uniref:Aerotolerance regulator N-terminal domain-containing protein n=1 Tax=Schlesneria paludicola TaxID=360056 RepID=A0A7C4LN93_9PLAN
MNAWLTSHFFHPSLVAGGAALLAIPVIIHLINRLRYRRVRFAAMEFLLASQQRNRRRILLEQLLLLLMRMAIVAALVLLIARFILDPGQLSIFRGAKAHHVVLLDDSASMRERWAETSAFREALTVIRELLAQGAQRPDTQTFSLLLLSRPDQPYVSQRDIDEDFVLEMATRLDPATFRCTHQALDLVAGLRAAQRFLAEEKGTVQNLHVVSDFRERDWKDQKALAGVMEELIAAGVTVNLVKTVPQAQNNLAVTELSGAVQMAAAGVPLRLKVGVTNFGREPARNVRVTLSDDQVKLPLSVVFDLIEPSTTAYHEVDVRLTTPTQHRLAASLDADVLVEDNTRHLAVDVTPNVPVLIVDGQPGGEAGSYVADALAADPGSTGISALVDAPDALRRRNLDDFRALFLLNVSELPADAVEAVAHFVRGGGGVAWYVGESVRPPHYNEVLYQDGKGIFPLPLGRSPSELPADVTTSEADLVPSDHPLFAVLAGEENPFLGSVHVRRYFPPADDWVRDDQQRADGVTTLARLRNGQPLVVEQPLGAGRVVACLTTADPPWNDWARNPSFVVFQLDLLKYLARRDRALPLRTVGEPIHLALDPAAYTETVEIVSPSLDGERTTRLLASPADDGSLSAASPAPPVPPSGKPSAGVRLVATFRETDLPGIYGVRLLNQAQQTETRLLAYNVLPAEGDLELATTANLRKRLGAGNGVQIQEPGQFQWLQGDEAGSEVRSFLLWSLLVLLVVEQWFAYRLSYHPAAAAPA